MYGAAAPFWHTASRRVKQLLSSRAAPLLAIFAAFSFTIQMFNLPVPPGTTVHAVGGTLAAIVLGPSAAIVSLTVAVTIQALFFGDGGVTTLGANAFNTAIALPLSGYAVYTLLSRGAAERSGRRVLAAVVGSYVGINVAGMLGALELGIQPLLWSQDGRALYSPYGLAATIPVVAIAHLTVAGVAEAALTGLVMAYLLRTNADLLTSAGTGTHTCSRLVWPLGALLAVLTVLVPLGLFAKGGASFEWRSEELAAMVGYAPVGLQQLSQAWQAAPLDGYQLLGAGESFAEQAPGYVLSALAGIALISALYVGARLVLRLRRHEATARDRRPVSGRRRGHGAMLAKTVASVTAALERTLSSDELARQDGLLQRLDPRAKIVFTAALLAAVALAHDIGVLAAAYLATLALSRLSRLSFGPFVKRVWLGIPLFALLVALPSLFSVPGRPVLTLLDLGGRQLGVTDNGLASASLFLARVGTSVSLVTLLVVTTRWAVLLKALHSLRLPESFLVVLSMTYRYLFLFLHMANSLFLARQSRTVAVASAAEQRRWAAAATTTLLKKSIKMSSDVHQAMLARGFTGEVRQLCDFRMAAADWLLIAAGVASAAALLVLDRGFL